MNKQQTQYDITGPTVVTPGSPLNPITQLVSFIQQTGGSAGNLTFNDCRSLDEASIENQIISYPYDSTFLTGAPGTQLNLNITNGLVISSVPSGMVLSVQYSIYVPG